MEGVVLLVGRKLELPQKDKMRGKSTFRPITPRQAIEGIAVAMGEVTWPVSRRSRQREAVSIDDVAQSGRGWHGTDGVLELPATGLLAENVGWVVKVRTPVARRRRHAPETTASPKHAPEKTSREPPQ